MNKRKPENPGLACHGEARATRNSNAAVAAPRVPASLPRPRDIGRTSPILAEGKPVESASSLSTRKGAHRRLTGAQADTDPKRQRLPPSLHYSPFPLSPLVLLAPKISRTMNPFSS